MCSRRHNLSFVCVFVQPRLLTQWCSSKLSAFYVYVLEFDSGKVPLFLFLFLSFSFFYYPALKTFMQLKQAILCMWTGFNFCISEPVLQDSVLERTGMVANNFVCM